MKLIIDREKYLDQAPADWARTQIGELFKFSSGKTRPKDISKSRNNQYHYPVYGGNGILGYSKEYCFDNSHLILGRVGEYCGCAHLTEKKSWISDNALYSKDVLADIDFDYFKYFFDYFDLNRFSNKNGQPLITQGNVGSLTIAKPELPEQKQIAYLLNSIQKAIQKQEEIINTATALKKSLLNKLFTEGTKGEPLKQTEIGIIPESWKVEKLGNIVSFTTGKLNCSQETFAINTYAFDQEALLLSGNNASAIYSVKYYTGKFNAYQRTYVISIKNLEEYCYNFLKHALSFKLEELRQISIGSSTKYLTLGLLTNLPMPKPNYEAQMEIAYALDVIDKKLSINQKKRTVYEDIFNTLLNDLMTGSIRVHNIDFHSKNSSFILPEASSKLISA
jgi:type I restriction enzyme, S subunit